MRRQGERALFRHLTVLDGCATGHMTDMSPSLVTDVVSSRMHFPQGAPTINHRRAIVAKHDGDVGRAEEPENNGDAATATTLQKTASI
jgi:hypothetical protein